MKMWQWTLLVSIAVVFLALLTTTLSMPLNWGIASMMGREYGYWGGFYSSWGMSWLFVNLRILFWLLPMAMITLLTMLFLDSQRRCEATEPVNKD